MFQAANNLQPSIDAVIEIETVTFDFGRLLTPDAIITGIISVTCQISQSLSDTITDPAPQSRAIGAAVITTSPSTGLANQAVSQLVGTMIGGITYELQCVAATSNGQQLSLWGHLSSPVRRWPLAHPSCLA